MFVSLECCEMMWLLRPAWSPSGGSLPSLSAHARQSKIETWYAQRPPLRDEVSRTERLLQAVERSTEGTDGRRYVGLGCQKVGIRVQSEELRQAKPSVEWLTSRSL